MTGQDDTPAPLRVLASPGSMPPEGNPYINLLYAAVRDEGVTVDAFDRRRLLDRYDVVHVNWPAALIEWHRRSAVLQVAKVLALLAVHRRRGGTVAWTVHDLQPHDIRSPRLFRIYFALFRRQVDLVVHLTASAKPLVDAAYPDLANKPFAVARHGHYRSVYEGGRDQQQSRRELGLPSEGPIALLVGQVRAYKRTAEFLRAATAADSALNVAVAGQVTDPALRAEIESLAADHPQVHLRLAPLSADEISRWVAASDVLVLPYAQASALHSGVALLGLSLGRPVVVAPSGPMEDLHREVGAFWVRVTDGTTEDAVRQAGLVAGRAAELGEPDLSDFEWPAIGSGLARAFGNV